MSNVNELIIMSYYTEFKIWFMDKNINRNLVINMVKILWLYVFE